MKNSDRLKVWIRDHWICQYCGEPVFFGPALKELDKISHGHGYFHPNGSEKHMLSLFHRRWASVDHVQPKSKGGKDSMDNYVTACMQCNQEIREKSSDQGKATYGKINKNAIEVNWDGLYSFYLRNIS